MKKFVIRAKKMIDGITSSSIDYPLIITQGEKILDVGKESQIDIPRVKEQNFIDLEEATILPGLVDQHVHLTLGTYGGYADIIRESDAVHLMAGVSNARSALHAGITTMVDAGARNMVAQSLREGIQKDIISGPNLLISGRPLTITGGHFHFCNDNECDGVNEVRKKVRQFVKEDVDLIKIMASGGGSANIGSFGGPTANQSAFNKKELIAAVDESKRFDKITMAHCEAYDSVMNAAEAGVDTLCHCGFILPDGTRGLDNEAVKLMAEKGLYYNPTLQTGSKRYDNFKLKINNGESLTNPEKDIFEAIEYKFSRKYKNLIKIKEMGVKIVAGSDATGLGNSRRLLRSLEMMVEAGMTPIETILSATANAAKSLRKEKIFGSLQKGLRADIMAVQGDPSNDISSLRKLRLCMMSGKIIKYSNKFT